MDEHRAARVREFIKRLIDTQFEGNTLRASLAIGLGNSALYEIANGNRSPGMRTLDALKAFTGESIAAILGEEPTRDELVAQAVAAEREAIRAEIVSRASFEYSDGDIKAYAALRNMLPWLDARSKDGAR